jgi:TrmH family RNA methyltransferase
MCREAKVKIITSKNNSFIIETAKLRQKKYRDKKNLFYIEGAKLLKEAMASEYRAHIKYIIICEEDDEIFELAKNFEIIKITREIYKKITDEDGFEGVMCVLEKPDMRDCVKYDKPVIILDNLQNPGNIGTIIRTADAVCRADIILTGNCADIYSCRTQRAAMGAIFRQNIKILKNIKTELEILKENGYNIFATYLSESSRPVTGVKFDGKSAVIFGSEGAGLSAELAELCGERIIIPVNPESESLNVSVAAGIIMWEMAKQGASVK